MERANQLIKFALMLLFFFFSLAFSMENKEEIFNLAVNEYKNNNYQKSLDYFLSIKEKDNSQIFYNIANCYFKLDDFGSAVLYYKKTLKFEPTHQKAQKNLKFILNLIGNKEDSYKNNFMKKLLFNLYNFFDFNLLAIFSLLAFLLFTVFFRLSFNKTNLYKYFSFLFLISFFVISGFFSYKYFREKNNLQAVVIKKEISCYSGPNTTFNLLFNLHEGSIIKIIKKQENWYLIEVKNNKTAWVKDINLEVI